MPLIRPRLLALWLLPLGCIRAIGDDAPLPGALVEDCAMPPPAGVAGWGVPTPLPFDDGPLWVFDALALARGGSLPGAAVRVPDAAAACAGASQLVTGEDGQPRAVLALTADEEAASAARTDGKRLLLMPRAGFVTGGRGYLYYDHMLTGPADPERVGTGLCVLDGPEDGCARVEDGSGSTVLWHGDDLALESAYAKDGAAFLLICRAPAAFEQRCSWAQVPVDAAGSPAAYRYWDAFRGWSAHRTQATAVLDEPWAVSAAPNPYQEGILAILLDPFDGSVSARTAADPTRPFGAPRPLFTAGRPDPGGLLAGGDEQPSLRGEGGRLVRLSYVVPRGDVLELHLATYRFAEALR